MKCSYQISNGEIHSFSFSPIDSRMYVMIASGSAVVIDPCVSPDALVLLQDKHVESAIVIPTHEHFDHISGVNWLRANLSCRILASEQCAKGMMNPQLNASAYFEALFALADETTKRMVSRLNVRPYVATVDEVFTKRRRLTWKGHKVEVLETPGHSKGSVCIVVDYQYVFTGDSLIKGRPTVTRLPGGSKKEYADVTLPFLRSLPKSAIIFPGHGECGPMGEFSLPRDD